MLDDLLAELVRLHHEFQRYDIPFILGGGMGLFLRDTWHPTPRQQRYPVAVPSRSTKDLDLFLTATVIADVELMTALRTILEALDYRPIVEYFQFQRELSTTGGVRTVRVDLLSAPPRDEDRSAVKIAKPRIRPKRVERIHAYLTEEAQGINYGALDIAVPVADETITIRIPSSFNYLILKLHAFQDRFSKATTVSDPGKRATEEELAGHHALDIFRIVTDMSEEDWQAAENHRSVDRDVGYLRNAAQIQRAFFDDLAAPGVLAFRETEAFRVQRAEFDAYLPNVVNDLHTLFTLDT